MSLLVFKVQKVCSILPRNVQSAINFPSKMYSRCSSPCSEFILKTAVEHPVSLRLRSGQGSPFDCRAGRGAQGERILTKRVLAFPTRSC